MHYSRKNILYIFSCNKHCLHGFISFHIICLKCVFLKFFDFTSFKHNQNITNFCSMNCVDKTLDILHKKWRYTTNFSDYVHLWKIRWGAPNILTGLYFTKFKYRILNAITHNWYILELSKTHHSIFYQATFWVNTRVKSFLYTLI